MNAVNRSIVLLLTLAVAVWTAGTPPASATELLSSRTHIFYYPWYQNPAVSGIYRHWQERIFAPPDNISSNYYPVLGAYDSGDFKHAVAQQMEQIRQAGVGVIVYSWWGQDSPEDRYVLGTMDVADRYGIKVAWHIGATRTRY
jgi:glycoprotein endo-alpha-1,2-mannosidase